MSEISYTKIQKYMEHMILIGKKKSSVWKLTEIYEITSVISGESVDSLKNKYYLVFHEAVTALVNNGYVYPYGSKKTSRNPFLYEKYKVKTTVEEFTEEDNIRKTALNKLNLTYYNKKVKEFRDDYAILVLLNDILRKKPAYENLSLNELSYEVFGKEKEMIEDGAAAAIMRKVRLKEDNIGCRIKNDPLINTIYKDFYNKDVRNVLVVENLETYWTLNKYFRTFPTDIDMLVYGQGYSSNKNFNGIIEYGITKKDKILYYGDIDLSGIDIYNRFRDRFSEYKVAPYVVLYNKLLASGMRKGVKVSKSLNQRDINDLGMEEFLSHFNEPNRSNLKKIVKERCYIPQESLNYNKLIGGDKYE